MSGESGATYFDGLPISKKQKSFMILMVAATFIEQMDLYNFALIAPGVMKVWNLTVTQIGHIHGAFAIGAVFGALIFGWLGDKKGRKMALATSLFVGGIGAVLAALSPNVTFLMFARALCGFGITGGLTIESSYLVEMVPSNKRSRYQSIFGAFALMGIPIAATVAKTVLAIDPAYWRCAIAIPSIGIIIGFVFVKLVYESPRWLVSNGRVEEGKKVFKEITGQELNIDPDFECVVDKVSYREAFKIMFSKPYIKRTMMFFGIFMLLYNAGFMFMQWFPTLSVKEGMPLAQAMKYQQWITLALIGAPIYGFLFGDKGGRKYPYAIAMSFVAIGILGISIAGIENRTLLTASVLLAGMFYISNQGFAGIYSAECYPTRVRVIIFSIFFLSQRLVNIFSNGVVAPNLYKAVGFSRYFLTVACIYVVVVSLILWLGPKTAGRSLENLTSEANKQMNANA